MLEMFEMFEGAWCQLDTWFFWARFFLEDLQLYFLCHRCQVSSAIVHRVAQPGNATWHSNRAAVRPLGCVWTKDLHLPTSGVGTWRKGHWRPAPSNLEEYLQTFVRVMVAHFIPPSWCTELVFEPTNSPIPIDFGALGNWAVAHVAPRVPTHIA